MTDNFVENILTYKKDSYIIVEGKQDHTFYVIKEGNVQLSLEDEQIEDRHGSVLGTGDFFGVVSAMSSHPYLETVQAITDVTLLAVPGSQFNDFVKVYPEIAMRMVLQCSQRLRFLNKGYLHLLFGEESVDYDHVDSPADLFDVAKFYDEKEDFGAAFYTYKQYLKLCPSGENVEDAKKRIDALTLHEATIPYISLKNRRIYSEGAVLYAQGEGAKEVYVILGGSVRITKIINGKEVLLAILKDGDIVGEMSLLEGKNRSVTAVVHEVTTLIAISRDNFDRIVDHNPKLATHLLQSLADRIWFLFKQLQNATLIEPTARMYDALIIQLEKKRIPLDSDNEYCFEFGTDALVTMIAGLSESDVEKALQKLKTNENLIIYEDKMFVKSIADIVKEWNYYKTRERRKKAFMEAQQDSRITIGEKSIF